MSLPPSQSEIVIQLQDIGRRLDQLQSDIAGLDKKAINARIAFKRAYTRAFLEASGAVELRKQLAADASYDLELAAELAEAEVRAARETIRVLRDRLEIGRSLGAAVRSEWAAGAVGQS
ncbi:hypothetical protein [Sediminivirga luteola]|uniref:Uncharacterized protein n=1 Tax=Sediminivirga luteola TaxID=1774748 RepID=A0A8J2XK27_9MICO|nr:hypothetical protein [Sediminivirga luteola]GGA10991.1 hypothetical protein GCM10011333_12280 [Sediminivirga luteola]